MGEFVVRRGLRALATLLVATLVFHASLTLLPGDPVRALFGFRPPPPELVAELRSRYHLDDPYVVQYLTYIGDLLRFDLGRSLPLDPFGRTVAGPPVSQIVRDALPHTAWLVGASLVLQALLATLGGLVAALRPGAPASRMVVAGSVVMLALPVILTSYMLQVGVALQLGWLPMVGVDQGWRSYVLPVLALSGVTLGTLTLFLRSELRQTLRAPFVQYATACGVRGRRIVGVHAFRVALPPVVAYFASTLGHVVMGILIVEGIFGLPGLGGTMFEAIRRQDRALLVSAVTLVTVVVIVANLAADLVVAALDPRVALDDAAEPA